MGGDGKLEHASTTLEIEGVCRRRAGGDESRTRWFILFLYHKDMTFAEFDERDQTWAGEKVPVSPQSSLLSGRYMSGGRSSLFHNFYTQVSLHCISSK